MKLNYNKYIQFLVAGMEETGFYEKNVFGNGNGHSKRLKKIMYS